MLLPVASTPGPVSVDSWHTSISGSAQIDDAISGKFGLVGWPDGKDGANHRDNCSFVNTVHSLISGV